MASILRSSKFVRYFAGVARNLVFNSTRGDVDGICIQKSQCLTNSMTKSLATQVIPSRTTNDSGLDKSLKRLDQDVRRTGRISRRELEDVLEELRHKRSATSTQSLLIIRCCGNLVPEESPEVRTQLVEEIWKTLENIGVPMDISHYNALLRVYLENEHSFSPTEFLANLEHKGVEPNRVTYQRLIAQYCQQGDIEGATRILEFMREKQLPVNENVFNALIMGHSQADDMESAAGILGVMQQAGLEPSADTYTTLLCGYAKKGDIDKIMATLEECDKKDLQLLDKDYMDIIYSLGINNHSEHADKIIRRMRQTAGYNQEAVNLILRLINRGQDELAYNIFLTMPPPARLDGEPSMIGAFLVRHLVKANRPLETIVNICNRLDREGFNSRALYIAAEASLIIGNAEQAFALFKAMKDKSMPVRQHYFWPLLAKKSKNTNAMLEILSNMCNEFNIPVGGETLREYVIPSLANHSSDEIVSMLRSAGVTVASAAASLVHYYLSELEIKKAADVATRYRAYYAASMLRRPLVQAYIHSEDSDSFISLLRQIHDSLDRAQPLDDDIPPIADRAELVGQFVGDVAAVSRKNRLARMEAVLQGLLEQGLSISNSAAERLQDKLGEELTSDISNMLTKLTSGELVPSAISRRAPTPSVMDETQLLRLQKKLEEKGESTRGIKKQLLNIYYRNKDLEKMEQTVKELEAEGFVFTGGMLAQQLDLYAQHENLEKAFAVLEKLREREPDFSLDHGKIIRVATVLVKNNKVEEAVKFLNEQAREQKSEDRSFPYNAMCWRLLNSLAEEGKADELKQVFDALVKNNYIEVSNVLLGPLIKVHIVRNDLAGAMEQFEICCQKYRATPWKNELACKMIQAEDAASLQKLTDLSTQVHGEVNSLYDLVFAFVECGRIRQARKILETPGLRSRPFRLNSACERYQQEGLVAPLEGLVEATRDISHIDRSDIYYHLLLSYRKSKDPDKALGLWTRMQEEDVQPSDEFLATLGLFLKEEGRDVPFVIPDINLTSQQPVTGQSTQPTIAPSKIKQALQSGRLDQALEIKQIAESKGEAISVTDLSMLIESLVQANRLGEAIKITEGMISKNLYPVLRVFRYLLARLSISGDTETLNMFKTFLSDDMKRKVSYDNKLCHAYVVAGKAPEVLKNLTQEIENASESQLESLRDKFPRGGVIAILLKHPELQSNYESLATKYAEKGITDPLNVLWMYKLVNGESEAAKKLWDKYLAGSPRIMFQYALQEARSRQDENIPKKVINLLKETAISEGARGTVHSCLIDVLVEKGKNDEALAALKEAVDDVCLENLNATSLKRLKTSLERQGKVFPYKIPVKNAKSSTSSSSSSDDEPTRPERH